MKDSKEYVEQRVKQKQEESKGLKSPGNNLTGYGKAAFGSCVRDV